MRDRDRILCDAIVEALADYPGRAFSVAVVAALAAQRLGEPTEPGRVVRPILQRLAREGRVRNVSDNPQRSEWRIVTETETVAAGELTELRSRARSAAAALQRLGVRSAAANRGAARVSLSAPDAERLAAVLSGLGSCGDGLG